MPPYREPKPKKKKPYRPAKPVNRATPGCLCRQCCAFNEEYDRKAARALPDTGGNMGRVQRDPLWREPEGTPGKWADSGSEMISKTGHSDAPYRRGNEASDRAEREAYGQPLTAAYRHIIGPTPVLLAADRVGARAFLDRINEAIEQGGWTRSEWTRLYKLRDKWHARSQGRDHWFNEMGNRQGNPTKEATANIKMQRIIDEMRQQLAGTSKVSGD